ncbi:MAG TPA: glycosyltransferase family A protein [Candidatus Sulfotelmatobacter sp.]|nr:glycosyltransferase family A protein [Candidatus Sulfotelmatobacter sp.]
MNTPDICLIVTTYKRPRLLRTVMASLGRQTGIALERVGVVVLDNDPEESARALVEEIGSTMPFPVDYAVCPRPGIVNVRNAALAIGRERAPFLIMLDDDEVPEPQWLAELMRVQAQTGAAAVIGPVPRLVPAGAPAWIRRGAFYDIPTFADGQLLDDGCTGNGVFWLASPAIDGLHFDTAFANAGGSDQFFFRQLLARGGRVAYAANAIAPEYVLPQRLCVTYILRRAFRRGNTLWYCDLRIHGTAGVIALRLCKAAGRIGLGLVTFVPRAIVRGKTGAVEAMVDVARGLGAFAGLFGVVFQEYDQASTIKYGAEVAS